MTPILQRALKFRSTYNAKVAERMRPFYDKAIKEACDVLIPYVEFPGNSAKTLHQKVCDGIRFFIDGDDKETSLKYAALRSRVKMVPTSEGVWIHFHAGQAQKTFTPTASLWIESFNAFLETPEQNSLELRGLNLDKDEVQMIRERASEFNMLHRVTMNEIFLVRQS